MLDSVLGDSFGEAFGDAGGEALEAIAPPAEEPPLPAPPVAPAAAVPAPAAAAPSPAPAPAADARADTIGDQKIFNVFLPKLTTEDKKEKAIPLIVEISGITADEAKKLSNRIVIPLVKGVDKAQADSIKERFMAIGILPRIRQQM